MHLALKNTKVSLKISIVCSYSASYTLNISALLAHVINGVLHRVAREEVATSFDISEPTCKRIWTCAKDTFEATGTYTSPFRVHNSVRQPKNRDAALEAL